MSLRRTAHIQAAGSPSSSSFASPQSRQPPSTPRTPLHTYRSPADTPSISSSLPFDWNAARSRKPPPYGSPAINKPRKSAAVATSNKQRVVRKKSLKERFMDIPSKIAFEIALFPNNVPLPKPKTSAWLLGGTLHLLHLCVRVNQVTKVPDSELGWESLYRESEGHSWFDWTVPVSFLLLAAAFMNALFVFTRIRLYRLHRCSDALSSPNIVFVDAELDFDPLEPPPLFKRVLSFIGFAISYSLRWLLGMKLPSRAQVQGKTARVQQLQMWVPGELEMMLFSIYSPAHAFLWMATGSENWMIMTLVMGLVGVQLNALVYSYNTLIKDKDIISAEVMHEYNEGFVYPRINPIKRDVAIMTHQSEVVNIWED